MYDQKFVPALGDRRLTPFYDATIALMTCERTWKRAFVRQIAPSPRDVIIDVGCGTGTLAIMLKKSAPAASVFATDPDPDVLTMAEEKARRAGVMVHFSKAYAQRVRMTAAEIRPNKIVSSLLMHQLPLEAKRAFIAGAYNALAKGGQLHIADYGEQRSPLMRLAFHQVQLLDGRRNTQDNAEGVIPTLMSASGFADILETACIPTPTGSISLYSALRG